MKLAITGSSGFIGSSLVNYLKEQNHEVVRIVRSKPSAGDILWDPENEKIDSLALDEANVDAIIHLAGEGIAEKKWSEAQKQRIRDSRIKGTRLISKTILELENKPSIFISSSAIGYYGSRKDEVLTEESESGDDFLSEVCREWESEAQPVAKDGITTAIIRTGHVLEASGGMLKRLILPFKLGIGGRIGSGEQYMSAIALKDHVRAITYIAENKLAGTFNLTGPNPLTNNEFTKALGKRLSRPTLLPTPLLPLKVIYGKELVDSLLLGSQRVVPQALTEAGFKFEYETIEDIFESAI